MPCRLPLAYLQRIYRLRLTGRNTQGVVGPTYTLFSNGKWEAPGWYFHTIPYPGPVDIEQGRTIIFFPLVGYRWKYGGKVQRVGEAADYWAAIPENRGAGTALSLTPVLILLLSDKSFLIDTPFFWRGQQVKG